MGRDNYERLEFLGDSILNFVVTARLFELRAEDSEGDLSRLRSRVVRGATLAKLAHRLELGEHIRLGEGELKSGGHKRDSILADALEAVFGAIYLDGGFEAGKTAVLHVCEDFIADLPDAEELKDPKTRLQEWLQGHGFPLPEYGLLKESGPPHKKLFEVQCVQSEAGISEVSSGSSRQKAEQAAAKCVLERLTKDTGK